MITQTTSRRSFLSEFLTIGAGLVAAPQLIINRSLNLKRINVPSYDRIGYIGCWALLLNDTPKNYGERYAYGLDKDGFVMDVWSEESMDGTWRKKEGAHYIGFPRFDNNKILFEKLGQFAHSYTILNK